MTTPFTRPSPPEPTNEGIPIGADRPETLVDALRRRVDALERALFKLQVEVEALRSVRAVSTQEIRSDAAVPLTRGSPLTMEGLRGVPVLLTAEQAHRSLGPTSGPIEQGVTAHGVTVGRAMIGGRYRTVVDLPAPSAAPPVAGNFTPGSDQPLAMGSVDMQQAARDAVLARSLPVQPGETIRVAWGGDAAAKDPI